MIDEPDGLLPIVTFDNETGWNDLLSVARPHMDVQGMGRLRDALGEATQSVVVERHYIDRDYRDTFSNFHSKRFKTPDSRCIRLHFFDSPVPRGALGQPDSLQPSYLGYSVIRPTRPNCIGRTFVKPKSRKSAQGTVCLCKEDVSIQGMEVELYGFPFISQDADVTVCAQAALWMLVRYFSDRYSIYPETYPVQIGNLTRDYSVGRLFPSSGLYVWQVAEALRRLGFAPLLYSREHYSPEPAKSWHSDNFLHLLYTYIESGIPVLAAFSNHLVVLFGHVSDYSDVTSLTPVEGGPFVFSSELNWAFVGNDDNGIPYQLLADNPPSDASAEHMPLSLAHVEHFVAPLPEKVFLPAESFETLVKAILLRQDVGYKTLSPEMGTPILRLFGDN